MPRKSPKKTMQFRNFRTTMWGVENTWRFHFFNFKLLTNCMQESGENRWVLRHYMGEIFRVLDGSTTLWQLRKSGVRGKWFMPKSTRLVGRTLQICGVWRGYWGAISVQRASAGVIWRSRQTQTWQMFSHGDRPTGGPFSRGRDRSSGNRYYSITFGPLKNIYYLLFGVIFHMEWEEIHFYDFYLK